MQRIHRIYTEKFTSYEQARKCLIDLNNKFGGRVKVSNITSQLTLPFFKRIYKVVYTIEDKLPPALKKVKKPAEKNKELTGIQTAIQKMVHNTLKLMYPEIAGNLALRSMSNTLTTTFFSGEFLHNLIKSGCIGEEVLSELKKGAEKFIYNTLGEGAPIRLEEGKKIIALVGPTGVGKTTTAVKIGTKFFVQRVPISFITLDLFRAGADQQLLSFTEHMGVKCQKIVDPAMANSIVKKLDNSKLIIIDTIGTSQKDQEKLTHIKQILDIIKPSEIFLVLPLTYNPETVVDVINKFSILMFNRIIISKVDEATEKCYPLLLSIRTNASFAPISYITCGQYPQDIAEFEPARFIHPILSQCFKL